MEFSMQRTDEYKLSQKASTVSARDYKSATDLVIRERERERERCNLTKLDIANTVRSLWSANGIPMVFCNPGTSTTSRSTATGIA